MEKEETTFRKLKRALLEMLRGYPEYNYYGKLEYFLRTGENAVKVLHKHEIIEELSEEEVEKLQLSEKEKGRNWYRLKPRGVDLAISMINLEYAEKMKALTITLFIVGASTFLLVLNQFLFSIFL